MARRHASAAARNTEPIFAVLRTLLTGRATVLEIGSGTGEHAVVFARRLPWVVWQPSDPDEASRASIAAWTTAAAVRNVLPPLQLDLLAPGWRLRRADLLLAVNVLHVAPPGAPAALVAGAADVLSSGGTLVVVGPFSRRVAEEPARIGAAGVVPRGRGSPGVPVLEDVLDDARAHDLVPELVLELPDTTVLAVARRMEPRRVGVTAT